MFSLNKEFKRGLKEFDKLAQEGLKNLTRKRILTTIELKKFSDTYMTCYIGLNIHGIGSYYAYYSKVLGNIRKISIFDLNEIDTKELLTYIPEKKRELVETILNVAFKVKVKPPARFDQKIMLTTLKNKIEVPCYLKFNGENCDILEDDGTQTCGDYLDTYNLSSENFIIGKLFDRNQPELKNIVDQFKTELKSYTLYNRKLYDQLAEYLSKKVLINYL